MSIEGSFGELFDICRNKHGGNEMSELANAEFYKGRGALRQRVLTHLKQVTDATSDEVVIATGIVLQSVSGLMTELKRDQLVVPGGKRPTRTGSMAQAWKLKGVRL
jgi:transcription initiation factor IIE alpha subunit